MRLHEDIDRMRDLSSNREIVLEDGQKLIVRRKDPHGFWTIHYEKGKVPNELSGQFTSFDYAHKAVINWSNKKFNKRPVEINKGFVVTKGDNLTPIS